jgi:hypothetical protein
VAVPSSVRPISAVPQEVLDLDDTLNGSVDTEPADSPPQPARNLFHRAQTIQINVGVQLDSSRNGGPPNKRRRIVIEDEGDSSEEDDILLDAPIPKKPSPVQLPVAPPALHQPRANTPPPPPPHLSFFPRPRSRSPPRQMPTEIEADDSSTQFARLQEMFPDRSPHILRTVLQLYPEVETAMELLLAFSDLSEDGIRSNLATSQRQHKPRAQPRALAFESTAFAKPKSPAWDIRAGPQVSMFGPAFKSEVPAPSFGGASSSWRQTTDTVKTRTDGSPKQTELAGHAANEKVWKDLLKSHEKSLPAAVINFVESALKQLEINECQILQVTGGFSFKVWERMRREKINNSHASDSKLVSEVEEDTVDGDAVECRVCMEEDPLVEAECGCAVVCSKCLEILVGRKEDCPACFKPIGIAKPKPAAASSSISSGLLLKRANSKLKIDSDEDSIHISPASSQEVDLDHVATRTRLALKSAAKSPPKVPTPLKGAAGRAPPIRMPHVPTPYKLRSNASPKRGVKPRKQAK